MNIFNLFPAFRYETPPMNAPYEATQVPYIPHDLLELILSPLNTSEISALNLSCRDWHHYIAPYLDSLRQRVSSLLNGLTNECIITIDYGSVHYQSYHFACNLKGKNILVRGSGRNPSDIPQDSDFSITAFVEGRTDRSDFSTIMRSLRLFYRTGRLQKCAYTYIKRFQVNLNPTQSLSKKLRISRAIKQVSRIINIRKQAREQARLDRYNWIHYY